VASQEVWHSFFFSHSLSINNLNAFHAGRAHCSYPEGVPQADCSTGEELAPQFGVFLFLEELLRVTASFL